MLPSPSPCCAMPCHTLCAQECLPCRATPCVIRDANDWRFQRPSEVPIVLKELHENGYKIVVFR